MSDPRASEDGFSLVELMVAMVVTLMVTGAIFGLIAGGQSAFRRNPELVDRQQSIRIAMDMIQRDIAAAGMGFGAFAQVFGDGLDGAGTLPSAIEAAGNTDILEIHANDGMCVDLPVDPDKPVTGTNVYSIIPIPDCFPDPGWALIIFPGAPSIFGWAHNPHADVKVIFNNGQQPAGLSPIKGQLPGALTPDAEVPIRVIPMQFIRYAIAPDSDAAGLPSLWRTSSGGMDSSDVLQNPGPGTDAWQLVARGVEDLQVWYTALQQPPPGPPGPPGAPVAPAADAKTGWASTPGATVVDDYGSLILQVRVALSARTEDANLQGARQPTNAAVEAAPRGMLVSTTTPRAALYYLTQMPPPPDPPAPGATPEDDPYAAYRWQ